MPDNRPGMIGLDIVKCPVTITTAIDSQGIIQAMTPVVPAAGAKIDAADKADRAVNHDKLLMVRSIERITAVITEFQTIVGAPIKIPVLKPFPVEAVEHAVIPSEHINAQRRLAFTELVEKFQQSDLSLRFGSVLAAQQRCIGVKLPSKNE